MEKKLTLIQDVVLFVGIMFITCIIGFFVYIFGDEESTQPKNNP